MFKCENCGKRFKKKALKCPKCLSVLWNIEKKAVCECCGQKALFLNEHVIKKDYKTISKIKLCSRCYFVVYNGFNERIKEQMQVILKNLSKTLDEWDFKNPINTLLELRDNVLKELKK